MKTKKWTRILAITLTGALLASAIGAGVVFAADPAPPTTPPQGTNYGELFLQKLTARLGISVDKYNEAVKGARQDVLDQQVKDGRLTQDQANQMKERWGKAPNGASGFGAGPGMMGPRGGMRGGVNSDSGAGMRAGGRAFGPGSRADCDCAT
jgi:hypothetical protein